jgi:signal transduction histidine kinase
MILVKKRLQIFHQLFLLTAFLVMAISVSLGMLFFGQMKKIVVAERKTRVEILARNLADDAAKGVETQNVFHSLNTLVDDLVKLQDITFADILDANGKVLVSSRLLAASVPPISAPTPDILEANRGVFSDQAPLDGPGQAVSTEQGNRYRIGSVQVGLSLGSFKRELVKAQVLTFFLAGGILLLGLLLASLLAQWLAQRINRLTLGAQAIGRGDYSTKIPMGFNDELGDLSKTLNQMGNDIQHIQGTLIQSEKMAGIGQFAAGVAHDVNNPIGVILGFAQGLIHRVSEQDPLMMPYKSIEREALRCKTLVQNLLAFSRGQGNTAVMKPEDLNQVIENALVLVATLARPKKVKLVSLPRQELPLVSIDSNQIQQIVINLCTNAIDAMPNGGTLTVGAANKGDHAEISVQDTGSGIPPEIRDRMFEAFFTTKEAGKGTGLGLSIITNIIKTHQGKIDVQSEVGKGTTFLVQLPLPAEAVRQAAGEVSR